MADYRQLTSSFFGSPRLFQKSPNDTESITSSPTSILDSKPFSCLKTPFVSDAKTPKSETKNPYYDKPDTRGVSLGLVDALIDEKSDPNSSKPNSRMVLFGSQLKIQVPPLPHSVFPPNESPKSPVDFGIKTRSSHVFPPNESPKSPVDFGIKTRSSHVFPPNESPKSPVDFGIKTRSSHVFPPNESPKSPVDFGIKTRSSHVFPPFSPSSVKKSPFSSSSSGLLTSLSASEIELSEDYTCVISYGPNPRTTHIFDDCIVESCCGVVKFSESRKESIFVPENRFSTSSYPSESFLSFCYNCRKNLGQGKDIYMYRGEKAFCSSECRYREMMLEDDDDDDDDEVVHPESSDTDDVYG